MYQKVIRPEKSNVFFAIAAIVSQRSVDAQTKCGTCITTKDDRILSTGYNSPPPGVDFTKIPNTRPEKYAWFIHSEDNAIKNMLVSPKLVGGARAYITGRACFQCTCDLWGAGIDEIYQLDGFSDPKMVDSKTEDLKFELVENLACQGKILTIRRVEYAGFIMTDQYIEQFKRLFHL